MFIHNIPMNDDSRQIRRTRKRFLQSACFLFYIPCASPHDYAPVVNMLNLSCLTERIISIKFRNGLLSNKIDFYLFLSQYFQCTTTFYHI